jgi:hypothetical protein
MAQLTGGEGIIVKSGPGAGTSVTASVDASAIHPVLTRAYGADNNYNEYIYLTGVASTVAGSAVTFDELGITALVVANAIGPVAIAMAATVAATFGWYQIRGKNTVVNCDAGIVDNAKVYIDGTAGRVDDTVVAGDQVSNAVFRSTDTANFCTLQLDYPYVNDSLG